MRRWWTACALVGGLASAGAAEALQVEVGSGSRYDMLYGQPVDVSLDDVLQNPESYRDRAFRTRGRLEISSSGRMGTYKMRGTFGGSALLVPVADVAHHFEDLARKWAGSDVEIVGVVAGVGPNQGGGPADENVAIQFWSFSGPPDESEKKDADAGTAVSLESLVTNAGRRDGQTVRVVGKFRGHNLYGDLPTRSRRRSRDWVIKDEVFAVWITGRRPKGDGWELDASLKRDTGKWVEVVGRAETRGGVTYIHATRVALSEPPRPLAQAQPPPPPPPRPKVAPVVVFTLPLNGESEVAPDTARFMVQFSKDMDEATFEGRVALRYADGLRPGERPFDAVKVRYERGRRVLIVDPGDVLHEGRALELLLLPGIKDIEGLELAAPEPSGVDGAVAVLRWVIAG